MNKSSDEVKQDHAQDSKCDHCHEDNMPRHNDVCSSKFDTLLVAGIAVRSLRPSGVLRATCSSKLDILLAMNLCTPIGIAYG